jgi:hypothetical protein
MPFLGRETLIHSEPLHRLTLLHRRLDAEIAAERALRLPDEVRLARLKKFKLAVKDRLAQYAQRGRAAVGPRRPEVAV